MNATMFHKIKSRATASEVGIGDNFPAPVIDCKDTNRKLNHALRARGGLDLRPGSRAMRLWEKVRSGAIAGATAAAVLRDHAVEFAEFDRQQAMIAGGAL